MKKPSHLSDYQEINLVDYLRTIKRHAGLIAGITLGVMVVAVLLRLWVVAPIGYYQGEAILSVGTIKGEPIQTFDRIKKIEEDISEISIKDHGDEIIVSARHSSPDEAVRLVKEVFDTILKKHSQTYNTQIRYIERRIAFIKANIQENEKRLESLQSNIKRLSPFSEARAITFAAYLASYNAALGRNDVLVKELEDLELEKTTYRETKILKSPAVSQSFGGSRGSVSLFVSAFIGLFLGLLLGVFWAFAKEWWEANKSLLK